MATGTDVAFVEVPIGAREAPEPWPVYWSPVWVGTLSVLAAALVLGLLAMALGAYEGGAGGRLVRGELGLPELLASIFGAFFAFALGGWVASRVAGLRRAETAALHGAVVWLLTLPFLVALVALGAAATLGPWYGGLAGAPAWAPAAPPGPEAAAAARDAAVGTLTALLVGLAGAVLGGWLGSGEPMTLRRHRVLAEAGADV